MKRLLSLGAVLALVAGGSLVPGNASSGTPVQDPYAFQNATTRIAGPQHWCGTNGITCAEPLANWEEFAGYDASVASGAHVAPYSGTMSPRASSTPTRRGRATTSRTSSCFRRNRPPRPTQDGSGGTDNFELFPAFWFGMILCDPNGAPNPDGQALSGHPSEPCVPDSDSNIRNSENPSSPNYFGLTPGQAFMEMQFYPPGWVNWPAGISCDATQWCAALNIDTFSENQNTGQFNNNHCLNTVGPEPVNFAFLTKDGHAPVPASPAHPEHFIPDPTKDFLMGSGDQLTMHMSDTSQGFRIGINDVTNGTGGSMTASTDNGFATVEFDPSAHACNVVPMAYHPMYSTSSLKTRVMAAAHTYNVSFSNEIGHFELCAKVADNALGTCKQPLGFDTNDPDNGGPDPLGDDNFCLPGEASTLVKIGGCLDIDGDFDGASYGHTWPGSITNPVADALLNPSPIRVHQPHDARGELHLDELRERHIP